MGYQYYRVSSDLTLPVLYHIVHVSLTCTKTLIFTHLCFFGAGPQPKNYSCQVAATNHIDAQRHRSGTPQIKHRRRPRRGVNGLVEAGPRLRLRALNWKTEEVLDTTLGSWRVESDDNQERKSHLWIYTPCLLLWTFPLPLFTSWANQPFLQHTWIQWWIPSE